MNILNISTLPSTGEAVKNYGPYIGIVILIFVLIFLFLRKKRKDDEKNENK